MDSREVESVANKFIGSIIPYFPFLNAIYETRNTAAPITLTTFFLQKIIGFNRKAYWPVHFTSKINNARNIKIGIGTAPGLSHGCYIQGIGKIYIGDYTIIAPNVGIISANHNLYDHRKSEIGKVVIGKYCWIGMNSVIMPNVTLGDHTIVGAGSIVTKSFTDGYCVVSGNPAKVTRILEKNKCVEFSNAYEYYGYIKKLNFDAYRQKFLSV